MFFCFTPSGGQYPILLWEAHFAMSLMLCLKRSAPSASQLRSMHSEGSCVLCRKKGGPQQASPLGPVAREAVNHRERQRTERGKSVSWDKAENELTMVKILC